MNAQEEIQHYRNTERRHMIAAKDALQHGASRLTNGSSSDADFVLACVNYLEFIIGRFVQQGVANTARLREVVPDDDAEDQRILSDVEDTLDQTHMQIGLLVSASRQFRSADIGIDRLKNDCEKFLDYYNSVLAQRKNPAQEIIQKHIDADTYWQQTNDVTADSIETEQALFEKIRELAPDGLQID